VTARRELRTLSGHTTNIDSIDFSPDSRLLASAGDDGATFLWDANTGEHLLTLISLDDGGEWMVVTPQGLFDGTPVSWNQILWRYNQDTFNVAPIEWFFNEFYYPGLLSDILPATSAGAQECFPERSPPTNSQTFARSGISTHKWPRNCDSFSHGQGKNRRHRRAGGQR